MMNILRRSQRALLALLLGLGVSHAAHATYSNVYFFGDSLSDTGNLYFASNGTNPPPPYDNGRFSNGLLWVEHLASGLGFAGAAAPSLLGGNNYAWAGAMSDTSGLADAALNGMNTGLQAQVTDYWAATHNAADPGALYVIDIGGNDLAAIAAMFSGADDGAARLAAAQTVVNNLMFSVNYLIGQGARNFLIANAPNLGVTPAASFGGFIDAAADVSLQYNDLLAAALLDLSGSANIVSFDLFGLITDLVNDTLSQGFLTGAGSNGLDNGLIPCIISGLDTCDRSVFFDDLHPTRVVHEMAGQAALAAANAGQVPEPASLLLLLAALLAAGFLKRRPAPTAAVA